MRSFREFLIERQGLNTNYDLPNMDDLRDPNTPPIGGYDSFAQRAGDTIEKQRQSGPLRKLYATKAILDRFANLAEQAASAIDEKHQGASVPRQQSFYPTASFYNGNRNILFMSKQDIVGGQYPQIRIADLHWGAQQGIFEAVNQNGQEYYYFYVDKLRNTMNEMRQQLMVYSRGEERIKYRAGIADDAWKRTGNLIKGALYGQSGLKVIGTSGI